MSKVSCCHLVLRMLTSDRSLVTSDQKSFSYLGLDLKDNLESKFTLCWI